MIMNGLSRGNGWFPLRKNISLKLCWKEITGWKLWHGELWSLNWCSCCWNKRNGLLSQHCASIACMKAKRVCDYKICSCCKVGLVMLVPGKRKEGIGILLLVYWAWKRKWNVTIVGGVCGIEGGGSVVLGSSWLLRAVAITPYMWVLKKVTIKESTMGVKWWV